MVDLDIEIKYNSDIKERFIPIDYEELFESCIKYLDLDKNKYDSFAKRLRLYYHQSFYDELLELKELYTPFNPDVEMLTLKKYTSLEYRDKQKTLLSKIEPILNHANYTLLTKEMLEEVLNQNSPYGVEVDINFEDFEEIRFYVRGESKLYETKRNPKKLFLVKETFETLAYRRLFIVFKLKHINTRAKEIATEQEKDFKRVKQQLKRKKSMLVKGEANEHIYIKLFKNIPHADLKMLFPNSKVKIKFFDKVKMGVLGGGGTVAGGTTLFTKITTLIDPISILIAIGAFSAVVWRQVKEVIFHYTQYMAELSKKLYFYNLGSNFSALNYIVNGAEESESKEALLVYLFLSKNQGLLTKQTLDLMIEKFIKDVYDIDMDFEVEDGLRKLYNLQILSKKEDYLYVLSLDEHDMKFGM